MILLSSLQSVIKSPHFMWQRRMNRRICSVVNMDIPSKYSPLTPFSLKVWRYPPRFISSNQRPTSYETKFDHKVSTPLQYSSINIVQGKLTKKNHGDTRRNINIHVEVVFTLFHLTRKIHDLVWVAMIIAVNRCHKHIIIHHLLLCFYYEFNKR